MEYINTPYVDKISNKNWKVGVLFRTFTGNQTI